MNSTLYTSTFMVIANNSASWVTDTNGTAYQHLQYMPWGEPLLDQRKSGYTYNSRYTFSGKERDEETGYGYFGARHYHSDLSIWLSVDPMSDKYPGVSPYVYCANNPVRLVDPDGRNPIDPRTGRELRMNLYCASVWYIYYSSKSCRDDNLYNKADRKIIPREFCEPDGVWEGAVAYTPHSSFYQISSTAKNTLKKVIRAEGNFSPREPPCDNAWKSAAEKGNYTFIDNYWDRSLWVKRRINRFNIITVKNNVISQIVNMTRNSDGEYDINSITTFECKFSEIKSKQNWLMLSVNYRTISVKETTQRYKNGQPYGEPTVKTYQSEQIL